MLSFRQGTATGELVADMTRGTRIGWQNGTARLALPAQIVRVSHRALKALLRRSALRSPGVAAVEFAITVPILMLFLGGVTDFGLAYYSESCLSTAVAAGAEYANLTDERGETLTAANIETVMQNAAAQSLPNASVTATATSPSLCYCMTGSPPKSTLTAAASCTATCAAGGTPSKYVQLTLTYNYHAFLPVYSTMAGTTPLTQSTWVPLQ
jgi:Flp pilus assembly protein TadG